MTYTEEEMLDSAYEDLQDAEDSLHQAEREVRESYRWLDKCKARVQKNEERILKLGGSLKPVRDEYDDNQE